MNNKIHTITEITKLLKREIENNSIFNNIWVQGEISNITYHSSGHIYLTLKDENSVLSGVFFKYANRNLSFRLEEGMSVFALGSITVFEKRGSYQFIISQLKLEGIGELQKRIEQLKKRLLAEGVFDPKRKKALPPLPKRIGIVTSPTGAALRDIIKVALRRFPNIEIIIAPSKVQGSDAPQSIARAIEILNDPSRGIDLIIAGRGGGSFEDLMPFNEEIVVRAFYNSLVPIISAVGHQIDHPLSDDAADLAAPTPSAAAEMSIPVKDEIIEYLYYLGGRSYSAATSRLRELSSKIQGIGNLRIFKNPKDILYNREIGLNDTEKRITVSIKDFLYRKRNQYESLYDLTRIIKMYLKDKSQKYILALTNLDKLSPLKILERGYSIAKDERNKIIKGIDDIGIGGIIKLLLHDGSLGCTVNSKQKDFINGKKEG